MLIPSEASVLTVFQDFNEKEIREKFFADDQSEKATKIKLLNKIVQDADRDGETEGSLRRLYDAQEE